MSDYEVLFTGGVIPYFLVVGTITGIIAWLANGSAAAIAGSVAPIELLSGLCWLVFASYARDIWQMPRVVATLVFALVRASCAYILRGCKPVFPEWTFKFELARAGARALRGGAFAPNVVQPKNARYFNHIIKTLGVRAGPKSCEKHGTTMDIVTFNGLEHVWIREQRDKTQDAPPKERFVVLYYHGGGFVLFAPHFFVDLGNRVRSAILKIIHEQHPEMKNVSVEVFLANYRKSPDYPYPVPQEDALLAFEHIVKTERLDPARIVFMGDSAGGGLCLSTMLRLKAKGGRMPGGALLSCPFVDFAVEDDADDSHCVLALELGQAMMDAFHPTRQDPAMWGDATPVYCDLSGLPPALIQIGSVDTIYTSAIKLYDKARADGLGASWELDVFPHMPHAFTVLSEALLPDVPRGIEHIADFAVRQFKRVSTP